MKVAEWHGEVVDFFLVKCWHAILPSFLSVLFKCDNQMEKPQKAMQMQFGLLYCYNCRELRVHPGSIVTPHRRCQQGAPWGGSWEHGAARPWAVHGAQWLNQELVASLSNWLSLGNSSPLISWPHFLSSFNPFPPVVALGSIFQGVWTSRIDVSLQKRKRHTEKNPGLPTAPPQKKGKEKKKKKIPQKLTTYVFLRFIQSKKYKWSWW